VLLSGKEMRRLFLKVDYEIVPGAGKGSYWKLKKKACPTITLPNHRELKPGTEHDLKKILSQVKN